MLTSLVLLSQFSMDPPRGPNLKSPGLNKWLDYYILPISTSINAKGGQVYTKLSQMTLIQWPA